MAIHSRLVYLFEPHKLEVMMLHVTEAELQRLDDEENYVILDPEHKQCFVNGEWVNVPSARFQSNGQLVAVNAG